MTETLLASEGSFVEHSFCKTLQKHIYSKFCETMTEKRLFLGLILHFK